MIDWGKKIDFDHKGIGSALAHQRLKVPLNQREYAWRKDNIEDLFRDLKNAGAQIRSAYFLGTIVLTRGSDGVPEIADGQQRLATITVLLAAIRDYLLSQGREQRARSIEEQFLLKINRHSETLVPQLQLNVDDNEFFQKFVLSRPGSSERTILPTKDSHRRLKLATELAANHVRELTNFYASGHIERLMEYVDFIEHGAQVILLTVPDYMDAFMMFETLNDRGLEASKADLLKNHILRLAGDRIGEAQQKWALMLGILESTSVDEIAVTYLRHQMITRHGPTKERELFTKVKEQVNSKGTAVSFADALANDATDYTALFSSDHPKWKDYGTATKEHIKIMLDLGVEQIRPLLFAVARHFSLDEAQKAFRLFVAWSVRFLIAGGRGGLLDTHYSEQAHAVGRGDVTTVRQLAANMADVVPPDAVFEAAFADARVSKASLARYYLRALEREYENLPDPEFIPNSNESQVNLEHILPVNPGDEWPHISPEVALAYHRRIGNMVLMQAAKNSLVGNGSFDSKRPYLAASAFHLSRDVANYTVWNDQSIRDRQVNLAKLAVRTWPITVR